MKTATGKPPFQWTPTTSHCKPESSERGNLKFSHVQAGILWTVSFVPDNYHHFPGISYSWVYASQNALKFSKLLQCQEGGGEIPVNKVKIQCPAWRIM